MKKVNVIICVATMLIFLISMCGCGDNSIDIQLIINEVANEREGMLYDDYLIEVGEESLNSFDKDIECTYSVNFQNSKYYINLDGEKVTIDYVEDQPGDQPEFKDYGSVGETKTIATINRGKALVCDYIEKSEILSDKETLKEKIIDIPVCYGKDSEPVSAYYANQKIFINREYKKYFSEWVIVHELIHYLCELSHGGPNKEDYPYSIFIETMTDLITMSIGPEENVEYPSGYFETYEFVLPYVGRFKEEAIRAYFYGFDTIWKCSGRYKIDVYAGLLDQIYMGDIMSAIIVNYQINEWACS